MSRTYATPLELELLPSRQQRIVLLVIYTLAVLSILLLTWALTWRLLFLLILLFAGVYLHRQSRCCNHIMWQSENNWLLITQGVTSKAVLLPGSLVSPVLVILLFRLATGQQQSVLIWPDSVHADVFRRLRVRLKLEAEKLVTHM